MSVALDRVAYQIGTLAAAYRHLHRRHWHNDTAFLLTDVDLDERLRGRMSADDIQTKTALRLIADLADLETAEALGMPVNAPVAFVHRRAADAGGVAVVIDAGGVAVLIAEGIDRGDVVRFDVTLR